MSVTVSQGINQSGALERKINIDSQGHLARQAAAQNNPMSSNGSVFDYNTANFVVPTYSNGNKVDENENFEVDEESGVDQKNAASDLSNANNLKSSVADLQGQIGQVESDASNAQAAGRKAQQTGAQIKQQQTDLLSRQKKEEARLQSNNQEMTNLMKLQQQAGNDIKKASAAYKQAVQMGDMDGANAYRAEIDKSFSLSNNYGLKIYSLQKSSAQSINNMKSYNAEFLSTQQAQESVIEEEKSATEQAKEVAGVIGQVSQIVQMSGQAMKMLGSAMISNPATAAVGGALINVGTVAEMVGQWGNTAASFTTMCCCAAEGDIQGALTNAAGAIMSGAAAMETTTNLGSTFASTKTQVTASNAAVEAVKQEAEALKNMGIDQKTAATMVRDEILAQAENGYKIDGNMVLNGWEAGEVVENPDGTVTQLGERKDGVTYDNGIIAQRNKAATEIGAEYRDGKLYKSDTGELVTGADAKKAGLSGGASGKTQVKVNTEKANQLAASLQAAAALFGPKA